MRLQTQLCNPHFLIEFVIKLCLISMFRSRVKYQILSEVYGASVITHNREKYDINSIIT